MHVRAGSQAGMHVRTRAYHMQGLRLRHNRCLAKSLNQLMHPGETPSDGPWPFSV